MLSEINDPAALCVFCINDDPFHSLCLHCGVVCERCASRCPHGASDEELLSMDLRKLATAQTALAKAEELLVAGTVMEVYWEERRLELIDEIQELVSSVMWKRACMASEALWQAQSSGQKTDKAA